MLHYKKIIYDCGCSVGFHHSTTNHCENHPNSVVKSVELSYENIISILNEHISGLWGDIKNSEAIEGKNDIISGVKYNLNLFHESYKPQSIKNKLNGGIE